jgi:hypothetical protein
MLFCGNVKDNNGEYIHSLHPNFHTIMVFFLSSVSIMEVIFCITIQGKEKNWPFGHMWPAVGPPSFMLQM